MKDMRTNDESILFIKTGRTLPVELLRKFKAECSRRGLSMTEKIAMMMREWLESL